MERKERLAMNALRLVLAVAMGLLLTALLTGCEEENQETADSIRPVRTFRVNGNSAPEQRAFPGTVKATRQASLAFRISGQIVKLAIKEGDHVQKGQLIAQLDQRDYLAAIADYKARIAGAQSVLNEAQLNIERNRKLLSEQIIAQSAFDSAQSTFETSKAEVLSLQQSLRRAQLNLQYTRLEAPFSGTIAIKHLENHEFVQAKEAVVQLEDTSSLDIEVDVPENIWIRYFNAKNGSIGHAHASFEAFPGRTFPVRMKEYETVANPGTQTYKVTLNMVQPEGLTIQPGMTAQVTGSLPDMNATAPLTVPISSVLSGDGDDRFVWVLGDADVVAKRAVTIGPIQNDMFTITQGLTPGETIVSAGVHYLRQGQKVRAFEGRIGGRE